MSFVIFAILIPACLTIVCIGLFSGSPSFM